MSEMSPMNIAVGDKVRVHFHPPVPMKSYAEGVVSRIDEMARHGPLIVVDVTHQVILDRASPIRRGHQDYILYERWNDFPEQIEVLSTADQELDGALASDPPVRGAIGEPNEAGMGESENASERLQVEVERDEAPRRASLIAAIFRRQR